MRLLRFASPTRAARDLRGFLASRKRHEWLMLIPALLVTLVLVFVFYKDWNFKKPYQRNIIYVQSWTLSRSDEEIRAQRKIDQTALKFKQVEPNILEKERQLSFRRVDDWLTRHGI